MKKLILIALMSLMNSAYAFDCSHRVVQAVSIQIDEYLEKYPYSVDTTEGIHYYWVDWGNEPSWPIEVTKTSLNCLEAEGKIHHYKLGSKIIWRR